MYCPACGAESKSAGKYCKRCGGNLAATSLLEERSAPSGSLAWQAWAVALATVAVCLGGLGIVFSTALDLMRPSQWGSVGEPTLVASLMIAFGSTTVFAIAALLIRLFARLMAGSGEATEQARSSGRVASDYGPARLKESSATIGSVTEHTTRNFEPRLYKEPGAGE